MRELADVSPLIGKTFTATSGNSCTFQMLGVGGVECVWQAKPSVNDIADSNDWVAAQLGARVKYSVGGDAKAALREFYRQTAEES